MSWDSGLGGLPEPTPDRMRGSEIDRLRNMTQAGEDAVELDRLTPKGTRTIPARPPPLPKPTVTLWTLLQSPFTALHRFLALLAAFLPSLFRLSLTTSTPRRRQLSPADTASRFLREFEELYGPRHIPFEPNLGYAQVTRLSKEQDRYMVVVLVSEEHDDTPVFCREVLCDGVFSEWIRENECFVWGGNVADSEAHTVANSLNCTRYPFVALIANIPGPEQPAQMTLLTKVEGLTSTTRLLAALSTGVSRTKSTLMQRRAVKSEQNFARDLRRQQEEAYTNSLNADRAREQAERRRREEEARAERLAKERQEQMSMLAAKREQWRLWKADDLRRMGLVGMKSEIGKTARVGLRLISGERIVQMFPGDIALAEVYSFVDCYELLFPKSAGTFSEANTLRGAKAERDEEQVVTEAEKPEAYEHEFMFRLVVPYPRKVIDSGFTPVQHESGLWPSGSIVVEEIEEDSEDDSEEEE